MERRWLPAGRPEWGTGPRTTLEGVALALVLAAATVACLGILPLPYEVHLAACVLLPATLWATVRFGLRAALFALTLPALASLAGLLLGGVTTGRVRSHLGLLAVLALCAGVAAVLAFALRRHARAHRELRTSLEIQSVLQDVLLLGTRSGSLHEFLEGTLDRLICVPWLGLEEQGAVFLADEEGGGLALAAHRNFPPALRAQCNLVPSGRCLCGRAAASRELLFASSVDDRHETRYEGIHPHGHYCVPILSEGDLVGVLTLYLHEGHARTAEEESFLQAVAGAMASVISRRRAEEALRASEERFELAIRGTDAGVWDWDLTTNDVYFSPRWKSMLGYEANEISDRFDEWERRVHPDDLAKAKEQLRAYLHGESDDYEVELRLRHKDGTWRWILARGAGLRDGNGRVTRMVGSHLDVTERHEAQASLHETEIQLEAAERIQRRLLPAVAPRVADYDLAGRLEPAAHAAGDDFDYLELPGGRLGLLVADVSGHGLGPSLLMASTQTLMRMLAQTEADPGVMLTRANRFLFAETSSAQFVSMLLVELDPPSRRIRYASAGHPPAYLLDGRGRLKERLEAKGPALSIFETAAYASSEPIAMDAGDLLLLTTDGVFESLSPGGEPFGEHRMLEAVRARIGSSAERIAESVFAAVRAHADGDRLADDATIVVLKARMETAGDPAVEMSRRTAAQSYSG